jgi:hypothetical protein
MLLVSLLLLTVAGILAVAGVLYVPDGFLLLISLQLLMFLL